MVKNFRRYSKGFAACWFAITLLVSTATAQEVFVFPDTAQRLKISWTHQDTTDKQVMFNVYKEGVSNPLKTATEKWAEVTRDQLNDTTKAWVEAHYQGETLLSGYDEWVVIQFTKEPAPPIPPEVYETYFPDLAWQRSGATGSAETGIILEGYDVGENIGAVSKVLNFERAGAYQLSVIADGTEIAVSVGDQTKFMTLVEPINGELPVLRETFNVSFGPHVVRLSAVRGSRCELRYFRKEQYTGSAEVAPNKVGMIKVEVVE